LLDAENSQLIKEYESQDHMSSTKHHLDILREKDKRVQETSLELKRKDEHIFDLSKKVKHLEAERSLDLLKNKDLLLQENQV